MKTNLPADIDMEHATGSNLALVELIRRAIANTGGRITFARFMEMALYNPALGYYQADQRRPGRGGDFLTAPEATPWFGLTLARQFAEFWERLGQPAAWSIREHGAGIGGLAYDILAGLDATQPAALQALTYHLVEINPTARQIARQAMTSAGLAGQVVIEDPSFELEPVSGVILGNEIADAMPAHRLLVNEDGEIVEGWVVWRDGWFREETGPLSPGVTAIPGWLANHDVNLTTGNRFDVSPAAAAWFGSAVRKLVRGYAMVIDYGYLAHELFSIHRLQGTLRGYSGHRVTDDPFINVGTQDLTAHVDFSALIEAGEAAGLQQAGFTTQGALLDSLDLGSSLLQLQAESGTTLTDYYQAQLAVARLIDPAGQGRFGVLLMAKDMPAGPPLRGLRTPSVPF